MPPSSFIAPSHFGLEIGAEPVRGMKARSGRRTVSGWFDTAKGTLPSLRTHTTLEAKGLALLEVNHQVRLMAAQPHHLIYHEPNGPGATIRRSYTPDVAMLMRDGRIVVLDFKVAEYAERAEWRQKEALLTQAYLLDWNVTFRTVTDEAILVEPRQTNAQIMLLHRRVEPDPAAGVAVATALAELGSPTTVGAICQACGLEQDGHDRAFAEIIDLAIRGSLTLDLGVRLGSATTVTLPRTDGPDGTA